MGKGIGELLTFAIGVAVSSHTRVVALPMTRSRGMLYISWLMGGRIKSRPPPEAM